MTNLALIQPQGMTKLTDKQHGFVDALVSNGGNLKQAAIKAGYAKANARRQAYELISKPHVLAAYQHALTLKLVAGGAGAMQSLTTLSVGAKSEYVRLEASKDILDRLGMRQAERHDHRIGGEVKVSIDLS